MYSLDFYKVPILLSQQYAPTVGCGKLGARLSPCHFGSCLLTLGYCACTARVTVVVLCVCVCLLQQNAGSKRQSKGMNAI